MSIAQQQKVAELESRVSQLESLVRARTDDADMVSALKSLQNEVQAIKMRMGKKSIFGTVKD